MFYKTHVIKIQHNLDFTPRALILKQTLILEQLYSQHILPFQRSIYFSSSVVESPRGIVLFSPGCLFSNNVYHLAFLSIKFRLPCHPTLTLLHPPCDLVTISVYSCGLFNILSFHHDLSALYSCPH